MRSASLSARWTASRPILTPIPFRSESRHCSARATEGGTRWLFRACGLRLAGEQLLSQDGSRREEILTRKRDSLKKTVQPIDGRLSAAIAFHDVVPEALAAWYDHVITESDTGVQLESERLHAPVAVVDIGGRTTDYVVVTDQAVQHGSSGSLRCGLLDMKRK